MRENLTGWKEKIFMIPCLPAGMAMDQPKAGAALQCIPVFDNERLMLTETACLLSKLRMNRRETASNFAIFREVQVDQSTIRGIIFDQRT